MAGVYVFSYSLKSISLHTLNINTLLKFWSRSDQIGVEYWQPGNIDFLLPGTTLRCLQPGMDPIGLIL